MRVGEGAVADEGVGVAVAGEDGVRAERAADDVVAAVGPGGGAAEGGRGVGGDLAPAALAAERRRRHQPRTRALSSVIIASHAVTWALSPRQNDWLLRASKSARETPCCSTQVK